MSLPSPKSRPIASRWPRFREDIFLSLGLALVLVFGYVIPWAILSRPIQIERRLETALQTIDGTPPLSRVRFEWNDPGCRFTRHYQMRRTQLPFEQLRDQLNNHLIREGWYPLFSAHTTAIEYTNTWYLDYALLQTYYHGIEISIANVTVIEPFREIVVQPHERDAVQEALDEGAVVYFVDILRRDGAGCTLDQ